VTFGGGATRAVVRFADAATIVRVEIDPEMAFQDIDRANNVWRRP
jgi:spermidine synthase